MEFLKKNYEKVILSIVLLVLAVAAALLPIWVSREKQAVQDLQKQIVQTQPKELQAVDLSTNELALVRLKQVALTPLSGEHNLFNPVRWQRRSDGTLLPIRTGKESGIGALAVVNIEALSTRVEFDAVTGTPETPQYRFRIIREAERRANLRLPVTFSVSAVGNKNTVFLVREMRPNENPTEFVLELVDGNEVITVTREKPFSRVAGYMADLKYDPERLTFNDKRVGDALSFGGETHKIVAITETNITVATTPNNKRTTIPRQPAR